MLVCAVALSTAAGINAKAWYDLRAAKRAYEQVEYARGEEKIQSALRIWYWRPAIQIWAARIARSRYDFEAAEKHLQEAKLYGADHDSLQLEWLMLRVTRGELDDLSEGLWKSVDEGHPESVYILETMARQYMHEIRLQEALRCLHRWLELQPDTVRALDWRGWVNERLMALEDAKRDYERVLALSPGRQDTRKRLAYLELGFARPQVAMDHFEIIHQADPTDIETRTALATCRFQLGQQDRAESELEAVVAADPNNLLALRMLAKLKQTTGRNAEAEELCRRSLALAPFDADTHYVLFLCLSAQGDREDEARAQERRYQEINLKWERLRQLLQQIELYKDKPDVMSELGEVLLNLGKEAEGTHWLYEALKRDPAHGRTHDILANYFDNRDPAKAAQHRQLAQVKP
jgi:tetratricopeptide (TPR) repeat protein